LLTEESTPRSSLKTRRLKLQQTLKKKVANRQQRMPRESQKKSNCLQKSRKGLIEKKPKRKKENASLRRSGMPSTRKPNTLGR